MPALLQVCLLYPLQSPYLMGLPAGSAGAATCSGATPHHALMVSLRTARWMARSSRSRASFLRASSALSAQACGYLGHSGDY